MKLTCESSALADALTQVGKALPLRRDTTSILNGIKLKAEGDVLTLNATDRELFIEKKIAAGIMVEGETVVTGRLLVDFSHKIDGEIIIDTTNEAQIKIAYGESFGFINTMDPADYPQFVKVADEKTFTISKREFKDLIKKIIFCAATEDNRPVLKGCSIEIGDGKMTGVSSDGYRLALCSKPISYDGEGIKVIVPARSMNEIGNLLGEEEDVIKISIEKNYFKVDMGDTKIVTRLIEGDYINYNKIIPTEYSTTVLVEKKALEASIDRAALTAKEDRRSMVKLEIKEKTMTISAESEISGVNERMRIELKGHDLNIGFNTKYLSDSFHAIGDEFIKLCFNSSVMPGVILPADEEDEGYMYLILPMKILG